MRKILDQLEHEWSAAAKVLSQARANLRKAESESRLAGEAHRKAKNAYLEQKEREVCGDMDLEETD